MKNVFGFIIVIMMLIGSLQFVDFFLNDGDLKLYAGTALFMILLVALSKYYK